MVQRIRKHTTVPKWPPLVRLPRFRIKTDASRMRSGVYCMVLIAVTMACSAHHAIANQSGSDAKRQDANKNTNPPVGSISGTFVSHLSPAQLEQHYKRWEEVLSQIAAKEKCTMFMDLAAADTRVVPNLGYKHSSGSRSMRMLARTFRLQYEEVDGVQVLFQGAGAQQDRLQHHAEIYSYLADLGPNELSNLIAGTVPLKSLNANTIDIVEDLASIDPNMGSTIMDNEANTWIRLRIVPMLRFTDSASGLSRSIQLSSTPPAEWPNKPATSELGNSLGGLHVPEPGALDMGAGKLVKLRELLASASKAFGVKYGADARLLETRYFINGTTNRKTFEAALLKLSSAAPAAIIESRHDDMAADRARLVDKLKVLLAGKSIELTAIRSDLEKTLSPAQRLQLSQTYGSEETLDAADLFYSMPRTVAQLSDHRPGLGFVLQNLGLDAKANCTLSMRFELWIGTPGSYQLGGGDGSGYSRVESDNTARIGLP